MPYGLVVCYQYLGGMYCPLFSGWKNYDNIRSYKSLYMNAVKSCCNEFQ